LARLRWYNSFGKGVYFITENLSCQDSKIGRFLE